MLFVPQVNERQDLLKQAHNDHGHFGVLASRSRLYHKYWWARAYTGLKGLVLSCISCQLYTSTFKNPPTTSVSITYLFEKFAMDFVGPLLVTKEGDQYILAAVEMFTRRPIAIPPKTTDAKAVSGFLYKRIFCQYGLPIHILTDNGFSFDNEIVDG